MAVSRNMTGSATLSLPLDLVEASDLYEIDPLQDPRWAELVENCPLASVFHSRSWLSALNKVYGYRPLVLTTCPAGSALKNGVVFCEIRSWLTGNRLVSLPFSDHCEPLVENSQVLYEVLSAANQHVDQRKSKYVEIRPRYLAPVDKTEFGESAKYVFHQLDLRSDIETLFRKFHKDCVQRKIRRAEREKLTYEEGRSEQLLAEFYKLFVMTRRRQYLPPQPISWFRALIASFGDALKIRVAYKDAIPTASILTLDHKRSMVYKYGCSDAAFNNLGGTPLLFWKTIQDAKARGFDELDMGRSDIDNAGLITFKEHWGAVKTPISYWTYPRRSSGLPSWLKGDMVKRIVSATPTPILEGVGKFLYPHIG